MRPVSPVDGGLDWMLAEKMNTETFSAFLAQVCAAHPNDFLVMIVDGASSHVSKELKIPENIRLHRLLRDGWQKKTKCSR